MRAAQDGELPDVATTVGLDKPGARIVPCPCCSQPLPDDGAVLIDADGGFIVAGGGVTRLTGSEFNLFMMLWQRKPRLVTRDQLMADAYWLRVDGEEPDIKIIDVLVCKIRKKLAPLGLSIDTVWGRGYRILQQGQVAP